MERRRKVTMYHSLFCNLQDEEGVLFVCFVLFQEDIYKHYFVIKKNKISFLRLKIFTVLIKDTS